MSHKDRPAYKRAVIRENSAGCPRCGDMEFIFRRDALGHLHEVPCPECFDARDNDDDAEIPLD